MTLTGPDISHYQGAVNFAAVRRAGHSFVILKATEGASTDPNFLDAARPQDVPNRTVGAIGNRTAAHAAGLVVGAYHFARATDPIAEADHFCATTDPLTVGDFVVLDWEVSGSDPVGWCRAWLDRIAGRCNVQPLLYMNQAARDAHDWSPVAARYPHSLWLAKYDGNLTRPPSGAWPSVAMKQYTDAAAVPGVTSPCDCNVFFGDSAALAALGHNPAPAPAPAPIPAPVVLEDIDMLLIRNKSGAVHLVVGDRNIPVRDPKDYAVLGAVGLKTANLSDALISDILAATAAPQAPAPVAPPAA